MIDRLARIFLDVTERLQTSVRGFVVSGVRLGEIFIALVFLAVVSYFSVNWALKAVIHSNEIVALPDITKKPVTAALDIISPKGLALQKQGEEFDAEVPVGSIIRQLPVPGTEVRKGKIIRVWLSQGGEAVFAPNLVGLPLRNGELLLRQNQLMLGEVSESYSLRFAKGLVTSQDPKADASLAKNALVNVVVSAGAPPPEVKLMPDFRQKTLPQAKNWAAENEIELKVAEDAGSIFPDNTVIAQDPAPDALIPSGQPVSVTISHKAGGAKAQSRESLHHIQYRVADGGGQQKKVKISLIDSGGEKEVFNGLRMPGADIDLTAPRHGPAMVRIFVNGTLVDEREMP
ncbi:MAG: PASTA domain-containing protein [Elusimicrobiaceae bacterium]|nr:PASTA domain-containing protein [Elusimicrobiaceae bacterium]